MSGAPKLLSSEFQFNTAPHEVRFTFDQDVSASLAAADLVLKNLLTSQTTPTGSTLVSWNAATRTATFRFPGYAGSILPDGNYLALLTATGITNNAAQPLAGDHDFELYFWNGDFDHDRDLDLDDQNILASDFNQSGGTSVRGTRPTMDW